MYTSVRDLGPTAADQDHGTRSRAIGPTVILLGLTSLFTDISSEMVAAVLPLYATVYLGLSPVAFGLVDGMYQGATAIARLAAGHVSDRSRRPKTVATAGYAISALCKLALLPVNGLGALVVVVTSDRMGKGVRTAPRDAMIAQSVPPASWGTAFGVHRALDTVGAMVGPLLAFLLLASLPGAYDAVFVTSFCFALVGVAIIAVLVRDPATRPGRAMSPRVGVRDSLGLLGQPRLRRICMVAGALALFTVSDGFLYLFLQRRESIPVQYFPLLFLGTSGGYLLLAVPFGRLADRVGRTRVFLGGHVLLVACYVLVLSPATGEWVVVSSLLLLGAYYAATDGVLSALTSRLAPKALGASAMALVQTDVALGKFGSALLFGALWTLAGPEAALIAFSLALVASLAASAIALRPNESAP